MNNNLVFTILAASLVSIAAVPVFVIAGGVQATPPGGDIAETLFKAAHVPEIVADVKITIDGDQKTTVDAQTGVSVASSSVTSKDANPGISLSQEDLDKLCKIIGQSIRDGINPPKKLTFWDSRLGKAVAYPFSYVSKEMYAMAAFFFVMKYRPDLLDFVFGGFAKFIPGLSKFAMRNGIYMLEDVAKTPTEFVLDHLPAVVDSKSFFDNTAPYVNRMVELAGF